MKLSKMTWLGYYKRHGEGASQVGSWDIICLYRNPKRGDTVRELVASNMTEKDADDLVVMLSEIHEQK